MTEGPQFYSAATRFSREHMEVDNENCTELVVPDIVSWNR